MGGINEQMVPKSEVSGGKGNARGHIDTQTGEVHLHDETVKPRRTVAVPISLWYKVWQELQSLQRPSWEFLDPVNKTHLNITVNTTSTGPPDNEIKVVMNMDIKPADVNKTFEALAAISKRQ